MATWSDTASPNFLTAFDAPATERQVFLRKTYALFTATLAAAGAGAYVVANTPACMAMAQPLMLIGMVGWILLGFFERPIARAGNAGGLAVLGLNALLVSLFLGPLLTVYAAVGGAELIAQAAGLTVAVFGGLTLYVLIRKEDYSWMGGAVSMALMGVLGVMVCSWFVPFSSGMTLVFTLVVIGVLCATILYQTSVILHHHATDQAPLAAAALFSSFVVLFLWILRLLASERR